MFTQMMTKDRRFQKPIKRYSLIIATMPVLVLSGNLFGQVDETLLDQSLEDIYLDLMNISVVSASKRFEKTFDAPLSVSVITQADIIKSGANTIPEALRLMPGVIVSEIVNGVYDVHVRGLDNMPPGGPSDGLQSSSLLTMVDNRLVYNYLEGRLNWDELSYNINDIDRIELVRGPASALYGPNAVTGVIHIITNQPETQSDEPLRISASSSTGQHSLNQSRVAIEYAVPDSNYGFRVSATNEQRDRFQDTYFTLSVHPNAQPNRYQTVDEIFYSNSGAERVGWADLQYPDPELAVDYTSWNTSLRFDNNLDLSWDLDAGRNESIRQALAGDSGVSPLGIQDNHASYFNAQLNWRDFTFQFFENYGQRLRKNDALPDGAYLNKYNTKSVRLAYEWDISINTFLQSEMRYKNIRIIDDPLFNGSGRSEITELALRLDSKPNVWRLIAAINLDYFALLDKEKVTYQFAASRPLSKTSMFRSSYSRAIRQPFMTEYFLNISVPLGTGGLLQFLGNQDLEFVELDNIEFGLRNNISDYMAYDLELWYNKSKNYSARGVVSSGPSGTVTSFLNLPLEADQIGLGAALF